MQAEASGALNEGRTGLQTPQLQRQVIANVEGLELKLELLDGAARHYTRLQVQTGSPRKHRVLNAHSSE